jgi:hypothetical protein
MATHDWEIYDVVDENVTESEAGDEITIDKVPNIKPDELGWSINKPDSRVKIPRADGGKVESFGEEPPEEQIQRTRLSGTLIIHLLLLLLFGYGFVLVVGKGVQSSDLDFKTYMSLITAFLGGLGFANFRKGNNAN